MIRAYVDENDVTKAYVFEVKEDGTEEHKMTVNGTPEQVSKFLEKFEVNTDAA